MQLPTRYTASQKKLSDWALIEVRGNDRESFFQGQVTNDLKSLEIGNSQLTARLSRVGKVQSFFFIARLEDKLLILCEKELSQAIVDDFTKFIIMDEVELVVLNSSEMHLILNPHLLKTNNNYLFQLNYYGITCALSESSLKQVQLTNEAELEKIRVLNGFPKWNLDVDPSMFINDSTLNELAISYKKGCFLGQETVAKIENNRGAAYYPVLIDCSEDMNNIKAGAEFTIDGKKAGRIKYCVGNYLHVSLLRDFRVDGKKLSININGSVINGTVLYLPFFKNKSQSDLAEELYHLGVESFQSNDNDKALALMKIAIDFDPAYTDAYESIGVILGRNENYLAAIEWMDKLLSVKSNSVMAHTNKSLYLMKLGKIEEAEAEKALATVKSFAMYGEEAKMKKVLESEKQKKDEDIKRREKMFLQVLEIDADDTIALFGLGDVAYHRAQYEVAINYLVRVVELDKKYSTAYLLLGKSYEAVTEIKEAIAIYQQGIEAASKQGDMMPANEMQSRLNQLIVSSRLS